MRLLLCLLLPVFLQASEEKDFIGKVKVTGDSVFLRWVPTDLTEWKAKIRYGILIRKISWNDSIPPSHDAFLDQGVVVATVFPIVRNDSAWNSIVRKEKRALILQGFLYEEKKKSSADFEGLEGFCFMLADQDAVIAKAIATFFSEKRDNSSAGIAYMISYASDKIFSTACILTCDLSKPEITPALNGFSCKQEGGSVSISWDVPLTNRSFAGYELERRVGVNPFIPLHEHPLVFLTSKDEKLKKRMTFTDTATVTPSPELAEGPRGYRLRGIDHFGIRSPWSDTVSIVFHPPLTCFPVIISDSITGSGKINLKWALHPSEENLAGFSLWKRKISDRNWERIGNALSEKRNYTDTIFTGQAYYRLHAYGFSGDSTISFEHYVSVLDSVPPTPPSKPEGSIDSAGIVRLKWIPNTETDLLGYRIFRRNSTYEEFVELSREPVISTFYTDTIPLNNLTSKVQYCLRALDDRYNNSGFSDWATLIKPDTIPPPPPAVLSFVADHKGVFMKGQNRYSEGLSSLRWTRNEFVELITLADFGPFDSVISFCDSLTVYGKQYAYRLIATDSSGNESSSKVFYYKASTGFRKAIEIKEVYPDRKNRKVILSWTCPEPAWKIIIYRSKKNEEPQYLTTLAGDILNYEDHDLYMNNVYIYRIKAIYPDGSTSLLSNPFAIQY